MVIQWIWAYMEFGDWVWFWSNFEKIVLMTGPKLEINYNKVNVVNSLDKGPLYLAKFAVLNLEQVFFCA